MAVKRYVIHIKNSSQAGNQELDIATSPEGETRIHAIIEFAHDERLRL